MNRREFPLDLSKPPLKKMFLPSPEENDPEIQRDGRIDPLMELKFTPVKGVVHRFKNRLLMFPTTKCFVRCRFCFRRNFWKEDFSISDVNEAVKYVRDSEVKEVILSGGDPLADTEATAIITEKISQLPKVEVVRISSKGPIFLQPSDFREVINRLTGPLCSKTVWFVFHVNHPLELNSWARENLMFLAEKGIPVITQTVLLKGVNDNAAVLGELFWELVKLRAKPYYLFLLDPTYGAMHFRVEKTEALEIYARLREEGSGLALPFLAYDDPKTLKKIVLSPYQ